jgi:hypothetical protein
MVGVPVTVRIRGIEYFDLVVAVDPRRDGTGSHSALLPPQARVTEDLGSFPAKRLSGASFARANGSLLVERLAAIVQGQFKKSE